MPKLATLPEKKLKLRTLEQKTKELNALYEKYKTCTACSLGLSRIKFVFGVGAPNSEVLFIGEGPGYSEDRSGEPFIGRAGQLLDKILGSIGLSRQLNAYIANIVKCHPMVNPQTPDERGNDRPPTPEEVATCSPILQQQIIILQPRFVVTLGSPSTKAVLRTAEGISKVRGKVVPFPVETFFSAPSSFSEEDLAPIQKTQVIPTYHPAALLRNPNLKADVWEDMKLLRDLLKKDE